MLRNLMAEMTRIGIYNKDIAAIISKDEKSVSNKILCKTEFTRKEMVAIKKAYFPNCSMDYLFEQTE
ncbi:MAG: hypothetical protein KH416_07465 [Dialister sp.]|uniref:hypothetical protein n=1 Tax=Dialister sp. TaxID=1955814 RepID=UPI00257DB20B|nr:hypothetical protein [Dialister sp.]MBS6295945.1 hypothetical protein [Dialister sp.]